MNSLLNVTMLAQEAMPSIPDTDSLLSGLGSEAKTALLIALLIAVTTVVITLWCVAWTFGQAMHRQRLEAELKRDMLDRGMSAEEVAKVIEATAPQGVAERWVASKNK